MCSRGEETAFHAIYECWLAQGVWEASALDAQLPRGCSSIVDWWAVGFKELGEEDVGLLLTVCAWQYRVLGVELLWMASLTAHLRHGRMH